MNRILLHLLLALAGLPCFAQERSIATSDGVQLYVKVQGRGTPCLYIHGGPGSGSYWLEKFSGKMLEQHFQMIYLDQRGVGRSTSPRDGNYSLQRMLQDFEEVRAALGIRKWLTLSHSFGGIPQVAYAQQHPNAILGLIMANSSLSIENSLREALPRACQLLGTAPPDQCADTSRPLLERLSAIYGKLRSEGLFWKMAYVSHQNEVLMDASFREISPWNNEFSNKALSVPDYWKDFRGSAPAIAAPVLFFYGKQDWMVGPNHYRGVKFPQMMLHASAAGHMPFLEDPAGLERALSAYQKKWKF